jgi:hypothetical protein
MFPLLDEQADNALNLFQIWLNLPRQDKFVKPYFSMFWADQVPRFSRKDAHGRRTEVTVIAGTLGDKRPPPPPPNSWARRSESDLLIAVLSMEPDAEFELPAGQPGANRMLYVTQGGALEVSGQRVSARHAAEITSETPALLQARQAPTEVLILHGRPIGEPVVKRGPFVMNSAEEIREAYADYRATGFGGWPWKSSDPIHGTERTRFARHADGRVEKAG